MQVSLTTIIPRLFLKFEKGVREPIIPIKEKKKKLGSSCEVLRVMCTVFVGSIDDMMFSFELMCS